LRMKYLVDTDIASYYLRGLHSLDRVFREKGHHNLTLSIVTVAQMRVLAHRNPLSKVNLTSVNDLVRRFGVLEINQETWETFSKIKAETMQRGETRGDLDILQASIAKRHNLIVVTHNVRHFEGIAVWEDWVERP